MWDFLKGNSTREDVAKCLEYILEGLAPIDGGDFTDIVQRDPVLDTLRLKVLALESSHPPGPDDYSLNVEGQEILRGYIRELRDGGNSWMQP